MPLGLGKSEKQAEEEGQTVPEDTLGGDKGAAAAVSDDEAVSESSEPAAAGDQAKQGGEYRPMAFRPAFLDETPSSLGAATSPAAQRLDCDAIFVSVARQDATEIRRFDDPSEAQSFLEELLEEGVPQEDVTAFSGHRLTLKVSHRPVVKLSGGQED